MATRATFLTGRTPRGHGVRCNGIPLDPSLPTFTQALKEAGYRTHAIGKIHANPWMPHKAFNSASLNPAEWPEAIPLWDANRITDVPLPYYGFESVDILCGWTSGHYRQWLQEREPNFKALLGPPPTEAVKETPESTFPSQLPTDLNYTYWASDCSDRFLADIAPQQQPFFLWCSIPDPHPPYSVAEPYYSMYDPENMPEPIRREGELESLPPHYRHLFERGIPTAGRFARTDIPREQERKAAAVVCGIVTQWDAMVGRIMAQLQQYGLADNTVVTVLSDHGQMLGDHWMRSMPPSHFDGNLRVPAVWWYPKEFEQNHESPALASHLDFAPTILDLAGVPIPEGRVPPTPECAQQRPPWPGRSLAPILRGQQTHVQESVIAENDADYLGMRQRTLITERYHITAYIGETYGELYDLQSDPKQLYNLWSSAAHQAIRNSLLIRMLHRFAETDSTLPRRLGHA